MLWRRGEMTNQNEVQARNFILERARPFKFFEVQFDWKIFRHATVTLPQKRKLQNFNGFVYFFSIFNGKTENKKKGNQLGTIS